ncbi:MAG TPA: MBOAT family O-acyltransferase [Candidatus Omnitrophota bacterium]|nr:MBOAT family O-acyltransferase [Candidatus Omnitrophota bacterium]
MSVTIITYTCGLFLHQAKSLHTRRLWLWAGILINLGTLIVLKYLPFFSENLLALFKVFSIAPPLQPTKALVAIGVSYYVFQALSYLFDIYLETQKPEKNLGHFFLYLAFFPKLLQGPIERASDLLPQLKIPYVFRYENMRWGILMITWGLFKKVVMADRLGSYVDSIYNNVHAAEGLPLLLATFAYAFQIYMDFSGYTDMALGSARLFNINLTQNFNRPYAATSVADFWRRWHISFSRWILDYIFKPLQMQWRNWRHWGTAAALIITFLLSGIWHGARWGFVIWGLLHGLFLASSVFYRPFQKKLHKILGLEKTQFLNAWQVLVTFVLVCFAWIFFRANNLADAFYVIQHMLKFYKNTILFRPDDYANGFFLLSGILFYMCSRSFIIYPEKLFASKFRWIFYFALFFVTFYLGTGKSQFIYFQF